MFVGGRPLPTPIAWQWYRVPKMALTCMRPRELYDCRALLPARQAARVSPAMSLLSGELPWRLSKYRSFNVASKALALKPVVAAALASPTTRDSTTP
jgi:hypothetical protein